MQPKHRLTAFRGWMPFSAPRPARYVRERWAERLAEAGGEHPIWMHVHIPFCPQRCSFCQCSTSLLDRPSTLESYLDWLDAEIQFVSEVMRSARVRVQYLGGGTPNMLSDDQLTALLTRLEREFAYEPRARRTFELLPSALRPGTIALARRFGFNRLSCGVQSIDDHALALHQRAPDSLAHLRRTFDEAYSLGYDEINVDLVYGLLPDRLRVLQRDLAALATLSPTTITVHLIIPTPQFPVHASVGDEIAMQAEFRGLADTMSEWAAAAAPGYEWVYRPNAWALVRKEFLHGPVWKPWYYSDNERIPLDMLGLGRFAHSHIIGRAFYETVRLPGPYDPDAFVHKVFEFNPLVDAGLDLVTALVGERVADVESIRAQYPGLAFTPIERALTELARAGVVRIEADRVVMLGDDHVFVDQLEPIVREMLGAAADHGDQIPRRGRTPLLRARLGDAAVHVHSEPVRADQKYYRVVGPFGISYSVETSAAPDRGQIEAFMARVVDAAESFLASSRPVHAVELQNHLISTFAER